VVLQLCALGILGEQSTQHFLISVACLLTFEMQNLTISEVGSSDGTLSCYCLVLSAQTAH